MLCSPSHLLFSSSLLAVMFLSGCSSSDNDNPLAIDTAAGDVSEAAIMDDDSNIPGGDGSSPTSGDTDISVDTSFIGPLEITSDNFEQLAAQAVVGTNLLQLESERVSARELLAQISTAGFEVLDGGEAFPGLTFMSQTEEAFDENVPDFFQSYTCDSGGSLLLRLRDFGLAPATSPRVTFDNCQLGGDIYNGTVESFDGRRANSLTDFEDYSRTGDSVVSITGNFIESEIQLSNFEDLAWENTTYAVNDSTGEFRISNLNWSRTGSDSIFFLPSDDNDSGMVGESGFVLLPDGTPAQLINRRYRAGISASFELISAATLDEPVQVSVDLDYRNDYFDWEGSTQTGFDLPSIPVTDLGDTVDLHSTIDFNDEDPRTVELFLQDPSPQWQNGSIRITDMNNGLLVMQPDAESIENVQFELNGSGEQIVRPWADGFQVNCASVLTGGCGDLAP